MPLYFKVIGTLYDLDALVGMTMSRGLLDLSVFNQGPGPADFSLANWAINMPHIVLATLALWIGFRTWRDEPGTAPVAQAGMMTIGARSQMECAVIGAAGGAKRRWLLKLVVLAVIALVVGPATFIATQCYGSGTPAAAAPGPLGRVSQAAREESFTFLTLPEWFIVYSAEEYGRFIGRDAPSGVSVSRLDRSVLDVVRRASAR